MANRSGTSKKTASKGTAKAAPKTASITKAKPSRETRDTLLKVRADISTLTKRLQAADRTTNKTVSALETALNTLAKQTHGNGPVDSLRQTQIDAQIETLKSHFTKMIQATQRAVSQDLKTVIDDPRIGTISTAIDSANARIERAEAQQLDKLTTLKSYIANLAREVDQSLESERTARQQDIANCLSKISTHEQTLEQTQTRLASIETDTATALEFIGDKVAQLADKTNEAREEQARALKLKISDIAHETQKNFDAHKDGHERSLEALKAAHETAKQDLNRDLSTLRTRIETLEHGLSPVPGANEHIAGNLPIQDAFSPTVNHSAVGSEDLNQRGKDTAQTGVIMPFIAHDNTVNPPVLDGQATPYSAPEAQAASFEAPITTPATTSATQPIPFTAPEAQPNPYAHAQATPAAQAVPYTPQQAQIDPSYEASAYAEPEQALTPHTEFKADPYGQLGDSSALPYVSSEQSEAMAPPIAPDSAYTTAYEDMPYADPAYAENSQSMDTDRPGGPIDVPSGANRNAVFTPSNLRAAVLGFAVLGVGYFAFNTLKGNAPAPTDLPSDVFVENTPETLISSEQVSTVQNIAPIGNYTNDIQQSSLKLGATPTEIKALIESGDPIAQYQLGLVKLQQGETADALELLRAASNKGQPAAQYRLAKLYETGSGVSQDLETAKDLIEKSARNGNRIAMHDLANFYANGVGGVTQDLDLAGKWFEKAAERGVIDSQYNIGYLYEFGFGTTQNPVQAYIWYGIAAAQGDGEAEKRIAILADTLSEVEISSAKTRIAGFKPVKINDAANGIFEKPANKAPKVRPHVAQVQSLLNQLGFTAGTADGQMGAKTRNAIIAFEKANGLPETGRVNVGLIEQLELAAGV